MKTPLDTPEVTRQEQEKQPLEAHEPGASSGEAPPVIDLESMFQVLLAMDEAIQARPLSRRKVASSRVCHRKRHRKQ